MNPIDPGAQYEVLARRVFQGASRNGPPDPAALAMHKPLLAPPPQSDGLPGAGSYGLDTWLAGKMAAQHPRHLVEFGCGFGSTLHALSAVDEARLLGITSSPYQAARASELIRQHGLADRAEIIEGDFEACRLPATANALLAVESIGYAQDLPSLARRLAELLAGGGHVFLVDDWRTREPGAMGRDFDRFLRLWGRSQMPSEEGIRETFTAAGFTLHERVDLSQQVPPCTGSTRIRRYLLSLAFSFCWSTDKRALIAAYLGGCYLEALYADRKTAYTYLHFKKKGK